MRVHRLKRTIALALFTAAMDLAFFGLRKILSRA
jgi:hypothetical protein